MTTTRHRQPVWVGSFTTGLRHCWQHKDGLWYPQTGFDPPPCETWREHPLLRGEAEWMRFIHAFPQQIPADKTNVFTGHVLHSEEREDDPLARLVIMHEGIVFIDGETWYAEVYLYGSDPVFKVGIDNENGWVRIEAHQNEKYMTAAELEAACVAAYSMVQQSYKDEEGA
jgi:hypothetical protein